MEKKNGLFKEYLIILFFPVLFLITAFLLDTPGNIIIGLKEIVVCPDILLVDYLEVGGLSATLVNASIVSIVAILLMYLSKKEIDGISIASIFTIMGFAFIGKNIINTLPIYLGGYLYTKFTKTEFKDAIIVLIFGTTLSPFVTEVMFYYGLSKFVGIILAVISGAFIGFILVPVSKQAFKIHEGYNLYNLGFTGGIIATVIMAVLRAFGFDGKTQSVISTQYSKFMLIYLLGSFLLLIIFSIYKDRNVIKKYPEILKETGKSPSNFKKEFGENLVIFNMGLMGILSIIYVLISKGDFNGPMAAGIFTAVGFAASGKHIKNTIPVLIGVFLMAKISTLDPSNTSVIMAGLFGMTISPIAGEFGFLFGVIGGMLHVSVGRNIINIHGGLNLYNNGFSGGIVAAFLLPLCRLIKSSKCSNIKEV